MGTLSVTIRRGEYISIHHGLIKITKSATKSNRIIIQTEDEISIERIKGELKSTRRKDKDGNN